jgi:lipoprotein-releasing system ATP-binding protein
VLLELKNIRKEYDTPSGGTPLTVLNDVSLQIESGDTIAVAGPSGSGKSTLLNIIGALDKPSSGTVLFNGKNLARMSDAESAAFRNTEIGFIFQLHHLLPQCTALENVLVPAIPRNKTIPDELESRARELLRKVGLGDHLDYFPAQLSGGERQRVAVVRALINSPKLVLADEPTGSLDRHSADNLGRILIDLNKDENMALFVVTHSPDLADKMDTVYSLRNGTLEKNG